MRVLQVQTIGFLSYLHSQIPKEARQPFLVLGPLSTLPNWMSEFKRWCPSMTAVMYHGDKEKRGEMRAGHLAPGAGHLLRSVQAAKQWCKHTKQVPLA